MLVRAFVYSNTTFFNIFHYFDFFSQKIEKLDLEKLFLGPRGVHHLDLCKGFSETISQIVTL